MPTQATETFSSLNLENIQGDILIGLQKDAEVFVFFTIEDVPAFKKALMDVQPLVTSTSTVQERERRIAAVKHNRSKERISVEGFNIGLTLQGIEKLIIAGLDTTGFDTSFVAGAAAKAADLGDPNPTGWIKPFDGTSIDGVLLVTGGGVPEADAHVATILGMFGACLNPLHQEPGKTRPQRGHEHFGFEDGVSQPGIRDLTKPQNQADSNQGLPGQDLLFPGEFVFGYPEQTTKRMKDGVESEDGEVSKDNRGLEKVPPLEWMRDGSYMVFRRLEQKVLLFRKFVKDEAERLGMGSGLLAARMVGRWPSGAPVSLSPFRDDPTLGADETANNDFEFGADPEQRRCPYAAHIRKTYPRDDLNAALGEAGEAGIQTHRLRRAGIPFGPEVDHDKESVGAEFSRGLLFVCYQTSIVDQFEFVQASWANEPNFVFGKRRPAARGGGAVTPGHDPIIGQVPTPRVMDEPVPNFPVGNIGSELQIPDTFVVPTASAYFFMPSKDAMTSGPLVDQIVATSP